MITHVLFDFFGTLVAYSPSRTEQGYEQSHALLAASGSSLGYEAFLELWSTVSTEFDERAERSGREFSMLELAEAFLARAEVQPAPSRELAARFVTTYVAEWNKGVRDLPELANFLARLANRYSLAVVTNTNDAVLVPRHLARMGVAEFFEAVVTSVEHGFRKPRPEIFEHALDLLGARCDRAVYVGDSFGADYQGAAAVGMHSFLIDPGRASRVPEIARLESLFQLEERLGLL